MKISDETKEAVLHDYQNGFNNKTELAKKYGISPRSVGRIISNAHDITDEEFKESLEFIVTGFYNEIINMKKQGKSAAEIAKECELSVETIEKILSEADDQESDNNDVDLSKMKIVKQTENTTYYIDPNPDPVPKGTKNIIIRRYYEGYNKEEIANELHLYVECIEKVLTEHEELSTKRVMPSLTFDKPLEKNAEGLLPCPYCGGNAKIRSYAMPEDHPKYDMAYYIQCERCSIRTDKIKTGKNDYWKGKPNYNISSIEAITRLTNIWNERTLTGDDDDD